jgi:hypothetical protein
MDKGEKLRDNQKKIRNNNMQKKQVKSPVRNGCFRHHLPVLTFVLS